RASASSPQTHAPPSTAPSTSSGSWLALLHRRDPCNGCSDACNPEPEARIPGSPALSAIGLIAPHSRFFAVHHVMACTLAESPSDPLHRNLRKLRQLRCPRCRFDCHRVAGTSSRAGVHPLKSSAFHGRLFRQRSGTVRLLPLERA